MARWIALVSGVAVLGLLAGLYVLTMGGGGGDDRFAQCRSGQVAGGASAIGGPFTLISETGETVTDEDVLDQPAMIYFGYTFCPDICPMDSARNAQAVEILEERGKIVKPVFVSIDPQRDTPEVLDDFTDNLHPRMLGLTGSEDQVKAASRTYRTFYQRHAPAGEDDEFYLVDHSTFTYLTLPGYGFVEFFRRDLDPVQLADRVQCFLDVS